MNQHTPGPWRYVTGMSGARVEQARDVEPAYIAHEIASLAGARLIAAAPALLAALEALGVKPYGYCFCANQEQALAGHTGECQDACAALALARGTTL